LPDAKTDAAASAAPVLCEVRDGVMRVTLNRPDAANAIAPEQRETIINLMAQADGDPNVRVVLLGAVGKYFCSGADVRGIAASQSAARLPGSTMRIMLNGAQRLIASVLDCAKPVVAAVQGPATGMGAHLAFACDLIVAAEDAWFALPFIQRGLALDAAGSYILPRRIGLQKVKELAFLGNRLTAAEAKSLGLVNQVCAEAEFAAAVEALAARLAGAATVAISVSKRLLNASLDADRAAAFLA
jgi:2-(1,2-epoxy-1,2-dihydrophenyl)acetyl-CoA isomerase